MTNLAVLHLEADAGSIAVLRIGDGEVVHPGLRALGGQQVGIAAPGGQPGHRS